VASPRKNHACFIPTKRASISAILASGKYGPVNYIHGRQKVKPKMADFEAILARHSQSPYLRGQTFFIFSWREVMGPRLSVVFFFILKRAKKEINSIYFIET
jgi:hypothetical protein